MLSVSRTSICPHLSNPSWWVPWARRPGGGGVDLKLKWLGGKHICFTYEKENIAKIAKAAIQVWMSALSCPVLSYNLQLACISKLEVIWPDACALPRRLLWIDNDKLLSDNVGIELLWQLKSALLIIRRWKGLLAPKVQGHCGSRHWPDQDRIMRFLKGDENRQSRRYSRIWKTTIFQWSSIRVTGVFCKSGFP